MRRAALLAAGLCSASLAGAVAVAETELDAYLFADTEVLRSRLQRNLPEPPTNHWMDGPELRVSPEFDAEQTWTQTYSLRFRPTSGTERRVTRELFDTENNLGVVEWELSLSQSLAARYHRVINLAALEVSLALLTERTTLERTLLVSARSLAADSGFDSAGLQNDVLRLERLEQERKRLLRQTAELRSVTVQAYLLSVHAGEPAVSENLAPPQTIAVLLHEIAEDGPDTAFASTLARLDLQQARKELQLQRARSGFGVDLLELSFEDKGIDSHNVTLGFRLPFGRRTNSDQRRIRDVITAQERLHLTERLQTEEALYAVRTLHLGVDTFEHYRSAITLAGVRLQGSFEEAAGFAVLRRHQLELLEGAAAEHIRLLHEFVDLLEWTGRLQQRPLRNWIASDAT